MTNDEHYADFKRNLAIKQQVREMKAVRKLIKAFTEFKEGKHHFGEDGWLDFYSYETLKKSKEELRIITRAMRSILGEDWSNDSNGFEIRLFCSDGSLVTMANGSDPDVYEQTVPGQYCSLF